MRFLAPGWAEQLKEVLASDEYDQLIEFLKQREAAGAVIYPPKTQIFRAFKDLDFDDVKVVIVGQDPYHGSNQANGLAFSVNPGTGIPPSLRNIFKEMKYDQGDMIYEPAGSLDGWVKQGVMLLNTTLTVEKGAPLSHAGRGWEWLVEQALIKLSQRAKPVVFVLWGNHAGKLRWKLDQRHAFIVSAHPSPLSATRGFFGSRPFTKINEALAAFGEQSIYWLDPDHINGMQLAFNDGFRDGFGETNQLEREVGL